MNIKKLLIYQHRLIVWVLLRKNILSRDLAKICNFLSSYMLKNIVCPNAKGWVIITLPPSRFYTPNNKSKDSRLRLLNHFSD